MVIPTVFIVPTNPSHEPASSVGDVKILSSPSDCDIHHALIIATQQKRDSSGPKLRCQFNYEVH